MSTPSAMTSLKAAKILSSRHFRLQTLYTSILEDGTPPLILPYAIP
jgi:hypothetical protein